MYGGKERLLGEDEEIQRPRRRSSGETLYIIETLDAPPEYGNVLRETKLSELRRAATPVKGLGYHQNAKVQKTRLQGLWGVVEDHGLGTPRLQAADLIP